MAAAVAQMGAGEEGSGGAGSDRTMMASLKPKNRKTGRVKIDPLMPKGGVAPNEWAEYRDLEEGCRGVLVSFGVTCIYICPRVCMYIRMYIIGVCFCQWVLEYLVCG